MSKKTSNRQNDKPPSDALMALMAPDGYYTYLGIVKPSVGAPASQKGISSDTTTSSPDVDVIDEDMVKKNYRRLSLKHHPDRPGGDAATFHVLNRAQKVLLHPKMREQYDLLGLDLNDDEEEQEKNEGDKQEEGSEGPTTAESIISHIFSAALLAIMQLGVRTVMMAAVSVVVCRYIWLVLPALLFLTFIAYRMVSIHSQSPGSSRRDLLSPLSIATGLFLMYQGRSFPDKTWSYTFWIGEAVVMAMFCYNSFSIRPPLPVAAGLLIAALVVTVFLGGNFWRYAMVVGLEAFLALMVALAFPLMEMVLEEIIKDKLRKVGEQVRAHAKRSEAYYAAKQ